MVSLHRNHNLFVESLPKKKKLHLRCINYGMTLQCLKEWGGDMRTWLASKPSYFFQEQKGERHDVGLTSNQNIMMFKKCVIFASQWKTPIFRLLFFVETSFGISLWHKTVLIFPVSASILGLQQWLQTSESDLSSLILLEHYRDNERAMPSDLQAVSDEILISPPHYFDSNGRSICVEAEPRQRKPRACLRITGWAAEAQSDLKHTISSVRNTFPTS